MKSAKDPQNIEKLISLAQKGDTGAFARVYQVYIDDIYRFCLTRLHDQDDAEDLASETFRKAWSYLKNYKSDNFRAFLYAIARNLCVDFWKKHHPRQLLHENIESDNEPIVEKLIRDDEARRLYYSIQKLPSEYQEVVTLRFMGGLSIKETAMVMNKSSIWVRVNQYRAIQKLKKLLKRT